LPSISTSPLRDYSLQPNETILAEAILADSLHIKQDAAVWKQEYIVSATNILANLNEMEFITKNINRLSENIPEGVDNEARNLKKMKRVLEKINDNEDIKELKGITNKVWKERYQNKKENKHMLKENIYPLSPTKKQRRHNSNAIF
jgi:pyruvate formate-lyase activating enzyme-like uncharacterized protein